MTITNGRGASGISGEVLATTMLDGETVAVVYAPAGASRMDTCFVPDGAQLFIGAVNTDIEPVTYEIQRSSLSDDRVVDTLSYDRGELSFAFSGNDLMCRWWGQGGGMHSRMALLGTEAFDCLPTEHGTMVVAAVEREPRYFGMSFDKTEVVCVTFPLRHPHAYRAAELYVGRPAASYASRRTLMDIEASPAVDSTDISWLRLTDQQGNAFTATMAMPIAEGTTWLGNFLKPLNREAIAGYDPNAGTVHFTLG